MDTIVNLSNNFVVNEPLCYISCKFGKIPIGKLLNILSDFYSLDKITVAKDILVQEMDKFGIENWPKPKGRRKPENKLKVELGDIMGVFEYADENQLLGKLPKFVALDTDNIPSCHLEEGDLRCILDRLTCLEQKMDNLTNKDNNQIPDSRIERVRNVSGAEAASVKHFVRGVDISAQNSSFKSVLKDPTIINFLECHYGLLDGLLSMGLLTESQYDEIRKNSSKPLQCNKLLIDYISLRQNFDELDNFCKELNQTKQSHLTEFIKHKLGKTTEINTNDNWPMSVNDKEILIKLHKALVEEISTAETVDDLFANGSISEIHKDSILSLGNPTKQKKNQELLYIMRHRSNGDFKYFLNILKKYHGHLKELLAKFSDPSCTETLLEFKIKPQSDDEQDKRLYMKHLKEMIPNQESTVFKGTVLEESHVYFTENNMYASVNDSKVNNIIQSREVLSSINSALANPVYKMRDVKVEAIESVELDESKEDLNFLRRPKTNKTKSRKPKPPSRNYTKQLSEPNVATCPSNRQERKFSDQCTIDDMAEEQMKRQRIRDALLREQKVLKELRLQESMTYFSDGVDSSYSYPVDRSNMGYCLILYTEESRLQESEKLKSVFSELKFAVEVKQASKNSVRQGAIKKSIEADKHKFSTSGCLVLVLLIDGVLSIKEISEQLEPFKTQEFNVAGKPKLIFIQQKEKTTDSSQFLTDGFHSDGMPKLPKEANFLYLFSTSQENQEGYRDKKNGSWFVQTLSSVLEERETREEIHETMTRLNSEMYWKSKGKQITKYVSMLTKELYLK